VILMPENRWSIRLKLSVTTMLLLLFVVGCHSAEEKAKQKLNEQQRQETAKTVSYLQAHYNAIVDWPQELKGKSFTIDVEPIFLRADHRPILFSAMLEDIRKENNGISLYFLTVPTAGEPAMRVILECGECDVQTLKKSGESIGDYAFVAQITAAAKSLDADENAPEFILHGKLIDARYIGTYAMDSRP
jgi:hypothetical protein